MSKDSVEILEPQPKFELGPLGNLNQVVKALGKTIRAMAKGSIDSQLGARICNGLGIMRACLETATLQRLEERLEELQGEVNRKGDGTLSPRSDGSYGIAADAGSIIRPN